MSTATTQFLVHIPLETTPAIATANKTFTDGLSANGITYHRINGAIFTPDGQESESDLLYGLLTNAQSSSALSLLLALNTALGVTVPCWTIPAMLQP